MLVANNPIVAVYSSPDETANLADELLYAMPVGITQEQDNGWVQINTYYNYEGYVKRNELIDTAMPVTSMVNISFLDVLPTPKYRKNPIITLPKGSFVTIDETFEDEIFAKVQLYNGGEGYCVKKHITALPNYNKEYIDSHEDVLRERVVLSALSYLNTPYRWGGKTFMGIDCSGLCSMAYLLNGIIIYRDAVFEKNHLYEIPLDKAKPGDLIFCPGHMALYLGGGQFIHSNQTYSGTSINSLDPNSLDYSKAVSSTITHVGSYWKPR